MAADLSVQAQLPLVWEQLEGLARISTAWIERGVPLADPQQLKDVASQMDMLAAEVRTLANLVEGDIHADR